VGAGDGVVVALGVGVGFILIGHYMEISGWTRGDFLDPKGVFTGHEILFL